MTEFGDDIDDQIWAIRAVLVSNENVGGAFDDEGFESVATLLTEARRLGRTGLAPLNAVGDREACRFSHGAVRVPPGFKEAYGRIVAGGWHAIGSVLSAVGDSHARLVQSCIQETFARSNMALAMYGDLTGAAADLIASLRVHGPNGTLFLSKLISGEWCGTMNLTEPQCGSDLNLIKTTATLGADGRYRLNGHKTWISGGHHDLAENILHLVLARRRDGPADLSGLSLFLVPARHVDSAGRVAGPNGVVCTGLEAKLGLRGNATCSLQYEDAEGELVGELHEGLYGLMPMMNRARRYVALQALAQAEGAYESALRYAQTRRQGQAVGSAIGPKSSRPITVIEHPDVRRRLLEIRGFCLGARAWLYTLAAWEDCSGAAWPGDSGVSYGDLVELLTPVAKGYVPEQAFLACSEALQVLGAAGYSEAGDVAQRLRDCRVTQIYEGTTAIQALDLVGRKIFAGGGRPLRALLDNSSTLASRVRHSAFTAGFGDAIEESCQALTKATDRLRALALQEPARAAAVADDYLKLFGLHMMIYGWCVLSLSRPQPPEDHNCMRLRLTSGKRFIGRARLLVDLHARAIYNQD